MSASDEAEVRQQREAWKDAFVSKDIGRIITFYAPGDQTQAFDILPPLQFASYQAYKQEWERFLKMFDGPIQVQTQDAQISVSGDLALVHALVQIKGTLSGGKPLTLWMRGTNGLRKMDGRWLVIHDHVSVPVDITTGQAAMNLQP